MNPHTRRLRKHRRKERRLEAEAARLELVEFIRRAHEREERAARSRALQPKPKKVLAVPTAPATGGALLASMLASTIKS